MEKKEHTNQINNYENNGFNRLLSIGNLLGIKLSKSLGLDELNRKAILLGASFATYLNYISKNFQNLQEKQKYLAQSRVLDLSWFLTKIKENEELLNDLLSTLSFGFLILYVNKLADYFKKRSIYKKIFSETPHLEERNIKEKMRYFGVNVIMLNFLNEWLPKNFENALLFNSDTETELVNLMQIYSLDKLKNNNSTQFFILNQQQASEAINKLRPYTIIVDPNAKNILNPFEFITKNLNDALTEVVISELKKYDNNKNLGKSEALGNFYRLILSDRTVLNLRNGEGKIIGIISAPTEEVLNLFFDSISTNKNLNPEFLTLLKNRTFEVRNYVKKNNLNPAYVSLIMEELPALGFATKEPIKRIKSLKKYERSERETILFLTANKVQTDSLMRTVFYVGNLKKSLLDNRIIKAIDRFVPHFETIKDVFSDDYVVVGRSRDRLKDIYTNLPERGKLKDETFVVINYDKTKSTYSYKFYTKEQLASPVGARLSTSSPSKQDPYKTPIYTPEKPRNLNASVGNTLPILDDEMKKIKYKREGKIIFAAPIATAAAVYLMHNTYKFMKQIFFKTSSPSP